MEKIKKALELARQTRTASQPKRDAYIPSSSTKLQVENKITHTQTRTIDLAHADLREKRIIVGDGHDAISASYKVLRTHVLQRLKANQWNNLAITSPTAGNGKTLTAINLAISLAREVNHSVLLADFDLRRPSIHHYFFTQEQPGISEYLLGDVEFSEVLFNPGIERLVILPGSKPFANSSEMLSSPKLVKLVEELKTRYPQRITIFDMPPLLSCDDVIAFSPYVDAILLVVEEGGTRKDELKRAYELIADKNIIGTVLNKSEDQGSAYGYY